MAKPTSHGGGGGIVTDAVNDSFNDLISIELSLTSFIIKASDVLANDTVAKGGTLSITSAVGIDLDGLKAPTVQILENGDLQVFAANPFNADGAFRYTISDGKGGTDTATVTFNTTQPNHPPIAVDDFIDASGTGVVFVAKFLTENDFDVDNDQVEIGWNWRRDRR